MWREDRERLSLNGMEDERSLRWRSQLQSQSGVISRQQASDAGFTGKAIHWRLRSGTWRRLHRSAYAAFTGDSSREGRLWAAVLRAGPGAVLSHETAAEIHGLADKASSRIHISVPAERRPGQRRKIPGVVIHRSRCLAPQWQPPYAGEPGSPLPCMMRPMVRTHRWSATTCTAWSARTACRRRGGKQSAGTAAAPGTWTTRTRSTR